MWHTALITAHAVAGGCALITGCLALWRARFAVPCAWAAGGMEVFLVGAIGVDWSRLDDASKVFFPLLALLGAIVVAQAALAARERPAPGQRPSASFVNRIGFTVIALLDAFVIILVLDAGAPGWPIALAAVSIAATGHYTLLAARPRLTAGPPVTPPPQ